MSRWAKRKLRPEAQQRSIFDPPAAAPVVAVAATPSAPANTTPTSQAAAGTVQKLVSGQLATIRDFIRDRSFTGATNDELVKNLGIRLQSVCARSNTLFQMGLIVDSGRTRNTETGRKAKVWIDARIASEMPPSTGKDS